MRISKKIRERLMRGAKKFAKRSVRAGVNLKRFRSNDYADALSAVVSGGGSVASSTASTAVGSGIEKQLRADNINFKNEIRRLREEKMEFLTTKRSGPIVPFFTKGDDTVLSTEHFKWLEAQVRKKKELEHTINELEEEIEDLKFNLQKEQEAGDARNAEGVDYIDQIEQLTEDLLAAENDTKKVELLQKALTETRKLLQDSRGEAGALAGRNTKLKQDLIVLKDTVKSLTEELEKCKGDRVELTKWKALTSQSCGESLKVFGSEDILQKAYDRYETLKSAEDPQAMPKAAQHAATLAASALNLIKIASRNTQTNNIAKQLGWDGNGNSAAFVDTEIQRLKTMEHASAPPREARVVSPGLINGTIKSPFAPGVATAPPPPEPSPENPMPITGFSPLSPNAVGSAPSPPPQTGGGGGFFSNFNPFGSASATPLAPSAPRKQETDNVPPPLKEVKFAASAPPAPSPTPSVGPMTAGSMLFDPNGVPTKPPCEIIHDNVNGRHYVYFDDTCETDEVVKWMELNSWQRDGGEVRKPRKNSKYPTKNFFEVRRAYRESGLVNDYGYESDGSIDMPLMSTWGG